MSEARDALAERIEDRLPDAGAVERKRMFGALAFMVNGRLAVGAGADGDLLVRVSRDRVAELLARPGARQAGMGERTMGLGWIMIDPAHAADDDDLTFWISAALAHNATVTT